MLGAWTRGQCSNICCPSLGRNPSLCRPHIVFHLLTLAWDRVNSHTPAIKVRAKNVWWGIIDDQSHIIIRPGKLTPQPPPPNMVNYIPCTENDNFPKVALLGYNWVSRKLSCYHFVFTIGMLWVVMKSLKVNRDWYYRTSLPFFVLMFYCQH